MFRSEGKEIIPQNLPVHAGPWMSVEGKFGHNSPSTITIMGAPEHLPSYQGWILRSANSMQNMAFPGKDPITISKGQPLKFRNMILVHKTLGTEEINDYYQWFREEDF